MKRNKVTELISQCKLKEHKQRVAFHEAGHAAGIYLNNKARHLPPVFFKIIFKEMSSITDLEVMAYETTHDDCIARVEGGRLIELLPLSIDGLENNIQEDKSGMKQLKKDYMVAFESDIVNLLIGPLAEAKYVADTDDEFFNHQIVNLKALKNYGGSSDLALAHEYLTSLFGDQQQKDQKLDELFNEAFNFVNKDENWMAITELADYILDSDRNIICCEDVISVLDQSVKFFHKCKSKARRHHLDGF
ncbi:MAG: hypothetical protein NTX38_10710 [Methylobacter sp.]|nr:hypothetical protein [Methylobacter sp.]